MCAAIRPIKLGIIYTKRSKRINFYLSSQYPNIFMLKSIFSLSDKALPIFTRQINNKALNAIGREKHKVPQKRASSLLNILRNEEFDKLKNGRVWPDIRAGDAIEVHKLAYVTAPRPDIIKGLVISKVNRASDTSVTIINNEYGTPVMRRLILYSPLIQNVKIIQKAFIHGGKKRVRRSKIYYYIDKDPKLYTIT